MRQPQDLPPRPTRLPRRMRGRRWGIGLIVLIILVLLLSIRTLAVLYTDRLWFKSVGFGQVWSELFFVKVGLFVGFGVAAFILVWVNLAVADRLAPANLLLGPEDELVRRYQSVVSPHSFAVRTAVSLVVAAIAATGTIGEWSNYLLFVNGGSFPGQVDPLFHMNAGFFVFKLPFLSFLFGWMFVALAATGIITVAAHYLNGGIRPQSDTSRVAPHVKVHVSVILALIALIKAGGYVLERFRLDLSTSGYVDGAGYTATHGTYPALTLLIVVSIAAAGILLYNIRQRGWTLPLLAVGLWAFVAVTASAIYPWALQTFKVSPAQSALESPYIARNIAATRQAMDLNSIQTKENFSGDQPLSTAAAKSDVQSLDDVRLWDPAMFVSDGQPVLASTFNKTQSILSYFQFNSLAMDRYTVDGQLTPATVSVRQLNDTNLPSSATWVGTHLQYTHGYGMFVSPANQVGSGGQPTYDISGLPPVSTSDLANITHPAVYFGLPSATGQGDPAYVIADSRQSEIDYQDQDGTTHTSHYSGDGGVQLSNLFTKLAFAVRLGDPNLVYSSQINSQSRIMFVRDITAEVAKAAPFLTVDSDPYPALVDGNVDWIQDAYTTTDNYPYAQTVDSSQLPAGSGLGSQSFNYVRNSVKIVINAYTGNMTFYVMTPNDPIVQAWEKAFPGLHWQSASKMPPDLADHIRYPEDMFMAQAEMYGRYHLTSASQFYNASSAWNISQDPGSGAPDRQVNNIQTTNAQGLQVSTGQTQRMAPIYQVLALPGSNTPQYTLMEAYVPAGGNSGTAVQTLSGFMVAGSDPGDYGQLTVYETSAGQQIDGPVQVEGKMLSDPTVSQEVTLLNSNGSTVELSNVVMVPVGQSMVYFQDIYVVATTNSIPALQYVIMAYRGSDGTTIVKLEPNLTSAVAALVPGSGASTSSGTGAGSGGSGSGGTSSSGSGTGGTGTSVSANIQSLIVQENTLYQSVQSDLSSQNLGKYQSDVAALGAVIQQLQAATSGSSGSGSGGSGSGSSGSTTTTTSANAKVTPIKSG